MYLISVTPYKIKIKFQYIQTNIRAQISTLDKSSMKSKFDIEKQNKYENMKAKSIQVYITRKYSKSNQIYFTKIQVSIQTKRNIQTISIKFNPQNKFEKKSIKFNTQFKYQPNMQ